MTREEFRDLWRSGFVLLDGATGSNLQKAGMPSGVCPEQWALENREAVLELQKAYVAAGTQILYAPTFGGNRLKLAGYGLEQELVRMNTALVQLSKEAAGGKALVAGDMTMTGEQLYPLGDLEFETLVDVYREQAQVLRDAGVDLFVVETMMSLQETRAAVLAIREVCDLPVMASLTFEAGGRTLFGTTPEAAVTVLQSLGADVVGMNCSTGPDGMLPNLERMVRYAAVPVLAKPNAGLPQVVDGETVYAVSPEEFARTAAQLAQTGARFLGGCCGTTPAHIRRLKETLAEMTPGPVVQGTGRIAADLQKEGIVAADTEGQGYVLSGEREILELCAEHPAVLGDLIDPAENEDIREALSAGDMDELTDLAMDQIDEDAAVLQLCVAAEGVDEKKCMTEAIGELLQTVGCPLCFATEDPEVLEAAFRANAGRALVNLAHRDPEVMQRLLPVAEKYGAPVLVTEDRIPEESGSLRIPLLSLQTGERLWICDAN